MSELPATRKYEGVARGNDVCKYCAHEFGVSLVDRPDFCPECGERGNLVTEWDQSEVLVAADAMRDELLLRIAALEAELAFSQDQRIGEIDRFNGQALRAELAEAERETP